MPWVTRVCVVLQVVEGGGHSLLGGTTLPLFSKRGRLRTGRLLLRVWEGRPPCTQWPSTTPAKASCSLHPHTATPMPPRRARPLLSYGL